MRAVTVIGVLLAAGAGTLRAQHAHQLEFGGFGSYSRYDKQFQLDNQFGGGGRLAFYLNDYLGLAVDGNVAYPFPQAGGPHTPVLTRNARPGFPNRGAIPSSRRAAGRRKPRDRHQRAGARRTSNAAATGITNGPGAPRAACSSSRPTSTAMPSSRRSAGIGW